MVLPYLPATAYHAAVENDNLMQMIKALKNETATKVEILPEIEKGLIEPIIGNEFNPSSFEGTRGRLLHEQGYTRRARPNSQVNEIWKASKDYTPSREVFIGRGDYSDAPEGMFIPAGNEVTGLLRNMSTPDASQVPTRYDDPIEQIANLNNRSQQILANAPEPVATAEQTVSFGAEQPQKKGFKETYLEAHANDDVATKAKLHFAAARQYAAKQGIDFDQLDDNGQDEVMMTVYKELQRLIPETPKSSSSILEEAYNNPTPVKQTPEERHAQDVASAAALKEKQLQEFSSKTTKPNTTTTQPSASQPSAAQPNPTVEVETESVAQPQPTSTTQSVASTAVDSTGMPLWQKASLGALGIGGGYLAYKAMLDNQERERQELAMQQQQLGMGGYGQRPSYF